MSKNAIIIQARMGSTRLPGKVLEPLGNKTVLWHVINRAKAVDGANIVCCAIPNNANSDPVATEAERCGALVVRGDELDVLSRYRKAAKEINADVIMRVTSDCPLIAPDVCSEVLKLVTTGVSDYACNNMPPSFPHGLDCEAFTIRALDQAALKAQHPYEREHVTPWIRNCSDLKHLNISCSLGNLQHLRWTLDYPEDLLFFRALIKHLEPAPVTVSMARVLAILSDHPELQHINAMHVERTQNCPKD